MNQPKFKVGDMVYVKDILIPYIIKRVRTIDGETTYDVYQTSTNTHVESKAGDLTLVNNQESTVKKKEETPSFKEFENSFKDLFYKATSVPAEAIQFNSFSEVLDHFIKHEVDCVPSQTVVSKDLLDNTRIKTTSELPQTPKSNLETTMGDLLYRPITVNIKKPTMYLYTKDSSLKELFKLIPNTRINGTHKDSIDHANCIGKLFFPDDQGVYVAVEEKSMKNILSSHFDIEIVTSQPVIEFEIKPNMPILVMDSDGKWTPRVAKGYDDSKISTWKISPKDEGLYDLINVLPLNSETEYLIGKEVTTILDVIYQIKF